MPPKRPPGATRGTGPSPARHPAFSYRGVAGAMPTPTRFSGLVVPSTFTVLFEPRPVVIVVGFESAVAGHRPVPHRLLFVASRRTMCQTALHERFNPSSFHSPAARRLRPESGGVLHS